MDEKVSIGKIMEEKKNYDAIMQQTIKGLAKAPCPRLLLHSCCGPCSTSVIERLAGSFELTVFFYNPNIDERQEYEKRKANQLKYINERYSDGSVKFIEGKYDVERFWEFSERLKDTPEGGSRCALCFELRLRETAALATALNFEYFTTTLTVSPMKNAEVINRIGETLGNEYGTEFLNSDFKKRAGYQRSIELSREYELYRQHFCGCSYSRQREAE